MAESGDVLLLGPNRKVAPPKADGAGEAISEVYERAGSALYKSNHSGLTSH